MTIFRAALTDYAQSLYGPRKDRAFTLGASDIGQCSRRVFFSKHGGERDPDYVETWGATLRGTIIEKEFWVPALRARFGANCCSNPNQSIRGSSSTRPSPSIDIK